MKPQSAKSKGRALQNWFVKILYDSFPLLKKGDIRSTSMGVTGADIQLSPAAQDLIPYQFECKSHSSFRGYSFLEQAENHGNKTPVVVVKANRKKPIVILYAEDFIKIIKDNK